MIAEKPSSSLRDLRAAEQVTGKRVALNKLTLTKRAVEAMKPADKPWIAWDDKLTGFGIQVHPSGIKSFFVNYRTGNGGRKASNKRVVLGRFGRMSTEQARRLAHQALGKVASGIDPAGARAEVRGMPLLKQAFTDYMAGNPKPGGAHRKTVPWTIRPLSRQLATASPRQHHPA